MKIKALLILFQITKIKEIIIFKQITIYQSQGSVGENIKIMDLIPILLSVLLCQNTDSMQSRFQESKKYTILVN